jgi:hypothetical protein
VRLVAAVRAGLLAREAGHECPADDGHGNADLEDLLELYHHPLAPRGTSGNDGVEELACVLKPPRNNCAHDAPINGLPTGQLRF